MTLTIPYDLEHDGVSVTLLGQIVNTSSDVYYGAGSIFNTRTIDFCQLRREVEMPGSLDQGSYDFPFSFKSLDLDIDSYVGVGLSVEYSVSAQMLYAGSMMKYTCKHKEAFAVKNYTKSPPPQAVYKMGVTLNLIAPPATLKLHINSTELNCETDWISGWIQGKHAR